MNRQLGNAMTPDDRAGTDVSVYGTRVWVSSYQDNAVYGLLIPPS